MKQSHNCGRRRNEVKLFSKVFFIFIPSFHETLFLLVLFEEKNQGFIYFQIDSVWGFAESQNYLKLIRQIKALKKKLTLRYKRESMPLDH